MFINTLIHIFLYFYMSIYVCTYIYMCVICPPNWLIDWLPDRLTEFLLCCHSAEMPEMTANCLTNSHRLTNWLTCWLFAWLQFHLNVGVNDRLRIWLSQRAHTLRHTYICVYKYGLVYSGFHVFVWMCARVWDFFIEFQMNGIANRQLQLHF